MGTHPELEPPPACQPPHVTDQTPHQTYVTPNHAHAQADLIPQARFEVSLAEPFDLTPMGASSISSAHLHVRCTPPPWGVRVDELAKSRRMPALKTLSLCFVIRPTRLASSSSRRPAGTAAGNGNDYTRSRQSPLRILPLQLGRRPTPRRPTPRRQPGKGVLACSRARALAAPQPHAPSLCSVAHEQLCSSCLCGCLPGTRTRACSRGPTASPSSFSNTSATRARDAWATPVLLHPPNTAAASC